MFTTRATLPTILGALVFIFGLYAFFSAPDRSPVSQNDPGQIEPVAQVERAVTLVNAATDETRTVDVRTPDAPSQLLSATLAALRTWLGETTLWPEALGVPTVFRLDRGTGVVLDFPLAEDEPPDVSVQQEQQLLASIEQTLTQQGVTEVYILTNGRSRPVFLEHLVVQSVLE